MSAWGGIDLDEDTANSGSSVSFDIDIDAVLERAEQDPTSAAAELQHALVDAAQNGNDKVLREILGRPSAAELVDINSKDEAGSTALIYASCFGHENVVAELLRFGADPNLQDANEWTALMWAANNNHLSIVKQLLAANADVTIKTSTGRTMFDLQMSPSSATYLYLSSHGYAPKSHGGSASPPPSDAFYEEAEDPAVVEDRFNHDLKESAATLGGFGATSNIYDDANFGKTDLDDEDESISGTGMDADAVLSAPLRTGISGIVLDFDWDTFKVKNSFALPREMIPEFLDLVISNVKPTLQKRQAPLSANALFLATRYFYYCGTTESFTAMTSPLSRRIELVVQDEAHSSDLAYLSYWMTNAEVYLYYLRKDKGLNPATQRDLQPTFESLILLISQQIQKATQKLLLPLVAPCLLDFDSIPEYGKVEYRGEWKLFRSAGGKEEDLEEIAQNHMRPPSHETRWKKPGPQRVVSVLSSLLLLFQIYGVHPVTQSQIIAKLFYFIMSRMFNKVVTQRRYLNRRRAMQIRLNMSIIEDWCRNYNFRPESAEIDSETYRFKSLIDIGRVFLAPLNQILAWLQTFSGFGSDFTNVVSTLQELKALNPKQLLQTATHYRFETREAPLSKDYKHYLQDLSRHYDRAAEEAVMKESEEKNSKQTQDKGLQSSGKQSGLAANESGHDLLDLDETSDTYNTGTSTSTSNTNNKGSSVTTTNNMVFPGASGVKKPTKRVIHSCVLISYELPIADEILLDEDLKLVEHSPFYEEADSFWGDEDASTLAESQGARYVVPYIPAELIDTITKKMEQEQDDELQEDIQRKKSLPTDVETEDLEEPALASRKPVDGEEPTSDANDVWTAIDDGDLGPVW